VRIVAAYAILVVSLLSACGGSDEEQIRDAMKSYNRALADRDTRKACSYLTGEAIREIARTGASCRKAMTAVTELFDARTRNAVRRVRVGRIRVRGDKATARFSYPRPLPTTPIEQEHFKVSGEWRLERINQKP
jgi:hypothetical protein